MQVAAETGALVMVHAENGDAIEVLMADAVAAINDGRRIELHGKSETALPGRASRYGLPTGGPSIALVRMRSMPRCRSRQITNRPLPATIAEPTKTYAVGISPKNA